MEMKLLFLDTFESEFKGKKYCVYRFLDPTSLNVISGTDLNLSFVQYQIYKCKLEWRNNKLKVIEVIQ